MHFQWLRSRLHLVALVAAFALAGASWLGAREYLSAQARSIESRFAEKHARTRILVAGTNLDPGALLDAAAIATREIPVRYVPSGTAHLEDLARLEGRRLAIPLKAGDPLTWNAVAHDKDVFSSQLAGGRRAITVPVDDVNAIAGLLSPGDRIDLLYVDRRGERPRVRPLLQQVQVLATGTTTAEATTLRGTSDEMPADRSGFATITLSVTPDEAQRVVLAQRTGELTAVLRHPRDTTAMSGAPVDSVLPAEVVRARTRAGRPPADYVEIIVGGASAGGVARKVRDIVDAPAPALAAPAPAPRAAPDAGNVRARLGIGSSATH